MTGEEYDWQDRAKRLAGFATPDRSVPVIARRGECNSGHFRSASDPATVGPTHSSRLRNRRASSDVPLLAETTHHRRQCARTPARISPQDRSQGVQAIAI